MRAQEILSQTPFDGTVLSAPEYRAEYDLMRQYFSKSGKKLTENVGETLFLYGYPIDASLFPESLLIP